MMEKLIPKLRFLEFNGNWSVKKMGGLYPKIRNGFVGVATPYYREIGVKYLQGKNIKKNRIDNKGLIYIDEEFHKKKKNSILKENDILMVQSGHVGECAVVTSEYQNSNCHALLVATPNEYVDSKFYVYYFYTEDGRKKISMITTGNTIKHILSSDLKIVNVPFPSLPEQQKIASFLTDVDIKITKLTKKKALLEQYKKGIMQKIFNQEIRFKDENGNNYPKWEEKKLGDFKNLIHGDGDWILSKDITANGDYKIVQLGNVGFGLYVEKKLKTISSDKFVELKGTLINKGDLLINRMVDGGLNCCILPKDGNYITSVDVCWIRQNNYFNNYFLMSLILFNKNQNKLLRLSSGSGRVRISKKNLFNKFIFKLPSIDEQIKIANFLSDIDKKIEALNTNIKNTQTFKKGLLQQMFV